MSELEIWIKANLSWVGFLVMVVVGSVVAHIKAYEVSEMEWPLSKHFWGIIKRLFYGCFAGLMVYFAHIYFQWDEKLSFIATGICSVFAPDLFDFIYKLGKRWLQKFLGVEVER